MQKLTQNAIEKMTRLANGGAEFEIHECEESGQIYVRSTDSQENTLGDFDFDSRAEAAEAVKAATGLQSLTTRAAQHTPGPWTADRHFIHAPTLRFVAVVSDGPQQESDARLIASAPETAAERDSLVAAHQAHACAGESLIDTLNRLRRAADIACEQRAELLAALESSLRICEHNAKSETLAACELMRAAIAKAKGVQS